MTFIGVGSAVEMASPSTDTVCDSHDDLRIRFRPRLSLHNSDDRRLISMLNSPLPETVERIRGSANGNKLPEVAYAGFANNRTSIMSGSSASFGPEELVD